MDAADDAEAAEVAVVTEVVADAAVVALATEVAEVASVVAVAVLVTEVDVVAVEAEVVIAVEVAEATQQQPGIKDQFSRSKARKRRLTAIVTEDRINGILTNLILLTNLS